MVVVHDAASWVFGLWFSAFGFNLEPRSGPLRPQYVNSLFVLQCLCNMYDIERDAAIGLPSIHA